MTENSDSSPLHVAQKLGCSLAGQLGESSFTELQLAYVNSVLPRFSDNPLIRMRQHLLLYWDQSYLKTTLIDEFCKCLPRDFPILGLTSSSPQILFGSVDQRDRIVYPAFVDAKIVKITELATFVSGRNFREIVNPMNKLMEGEEVQRQLLKLGRREIPAKEIEEAEAHGIYYNPFRAQLRFKPDTTIFAASRPLSNRIYSFLRKSGMLHRFHILQREISDDEAREFFVRNYKPDFALRDRLLSLNTKLCSISIKNVDMPSEEIVKDIFLSLEGVVEEETHGRKVRIAEIIDVRTKGDILRELASFATLRTITENGFDDIDTLEYDSKDIEFIKSDIGHFVEAKIYPLFVEEWSQLAPSRQKRRQRLEDLIIDYLSDGEERGRSAIVNRILPEGIAKEATVDNALRDLRNSGQIVSTRHGFYKIAKEVKRINVTKPHLL